MSTSAQLARNCACCTSSQVANRDRTDCWISFSSQSDWEHTKSTVSSNGYTTRVTEAQPKGMILFAEAKRESLIQGSPALVICRLRIGLSVAGVSWGWLWSDEGCVVSGCRTVIPLLGRLARSLSYSALSSTWTESSLSQRYKDPTEEGLAGQEEQRLKATFRPQIPTDVWFRWNFLSKASAWWEEVQL